MGHLSGLLEDLLSAMTRPVELGCDFDIPHTA